MTQKSRPIRIKKTADFNAGTSGHDRNYSFAFSDNIEDWQKSKRLKTNAQLREIYKKSKV